MIRRVQQIKDFGVFADFQWPATLPEFKQFNLIYGWNYSGKTTLSRVFRCFELKQPHLDFAAAQVQLKAEGGAIHHLATPDTAPAFRVFNSDFIHTNLSFESGSATPILVLGAEDIAKQEALKSKIVERETLNLNFGNNRSKSEEISADIEKALTKYARDFIKTQLAEVNYDKKRFLPKVKECESSHEKFLLDEASLVSCLAIYNSTDKRPVLSAKTNSLSSIAELKIKTASILARVVTASIPIERLKQNPAIESWVKDGRPLHKGKTTCQFCEQELPQDLLGKLTEHFSIEYENLMGELTSLQKTIEAAQKEEITLDSKADFYPEFAGRFTDEKNRLMKLLKERQSALGVLLVDLVEKKTKAFTSIVGAECGDPTAQIAEVVAAINKVIADHNNRTSEFDKNRKEAFSKLENHYAARFVRDEKYTQQNKNISDLKLAMSEQAKKIGELDVEIRNLEAALSEASKGAERINELLAAYFGKHDLRIEVSADKRFQIIRGGAVAKNMSEGEKTAIAFAYFITRVQDRRHPLNDTIVVIDDPISSLDANHLFNTYALIKIQLAGCRQLFISTHSFEFYNLIRDWVSEDEETKKPQANWKKWSVLLIRRMDNGMATVEEIPKELLKFKSEYHYLFSTLYHFDKAGGVNFDWLLSLPNITRRFMEAFGGIMIPLSKGLHSKMERIFPDEVLRERVWKFINHYSHNTTITRSLTIPDTSECRAVVKACLDAVNAWDNDYYTDLVSEVC